ncbi:MAG: DMT family transporter [Nocardiopsis sp. BM-2018]|nr:MAG: DMT family transporter [Nocardiopsis sp. BM-2018]
MSDNLRGSLLMVLAMAAFALEDMFIKLLAERVPLGQVVGFLGLGGTAVFAVIMRLKGQRLLAPEALSGPVILRNLCEVVGGIAFVLAIVLTPLSSASAILQATPLAVTLGAALFLGAQVGWRRWTAILVGFAGVLLIVRPGLAGFQPASLFAVLAVVLLATRDLATRRVPAHVSGWQLSGWAYAAIIPGGLFLLAVFGEVPVVPAAFDAALMGAMKRAGGVCRPGRGRYRSRH